MDRGRTPTFRLLAGLGVTLSAVAVYSAYTVVQLRTLESLQAATIDRNRIDSLLLLRIQNNLNSVALTLRDMLDHTEPYPLTAWRAPLARIRTDLADAVEREAKYSPSSGSSESRSYLSTSMRQFWDALDRVFALAESGQTEKAGDTIRLSLQARQQALARRFEHRQASEALRQRLAHAPHGVSALQQMREPIGPKPRCCA